jgi:Zn-dependent protease
MEPATFRPAPPPLGLALLAGAAGGALVGFLASVPALAGAAMGAAAAAIAVGVRHASALRLVATDQGVTVKGGEGEGLEARWREVRLGFGEARWPGDRERPPSRYAILADSRGRAFAFADLSGAGAPAPVQGPDGRRVPVVDLRDAPLLLALVVERAGAWHVFPPELQSPPVNEPGPDSEPGDPHPSRQRPGTTPRVGLLGVLAKLGGALAKALKTANLGWAVASFAAYGFLFTWRFAVALLLQLFVHEYGHVHAMRRTGMKVRGMYFIPFLGAVAVTEDAFTSRRQQAYVALNGPFWGSAFALVPLALWLATRDPEYAAVASWWALLNLFNLLPILPLDGGRLLQALAFSFSSTLGVALTVLGLAAAVVLAVAFGYGLVWLVALLGAAELISESQARAGGRALRLLPEPARLGPDHYRYLRAVAGPPLGSPSEDRYLRYLARVEKAARAAPLAAREMVAWGAAYAGLAAVLLVAVHFLTLATGGAGPAQLLR